jgi:putative oxygen-independent coproporphyrinogen III oxidase
MSRYHRVRFWPPSKQTMNNKELPGLYIHIPFCKTKCPYCDFYSIIDHAAMDGFITALKKEAVLYKKAFQQFDSLYFGGGTPSLIDEKELAGIFTTLRAQFTFSPDTEITVEMNPDDVTTEKLECYRKLGVNRISLGVQSLNDKELALLKRRHTAEEAKKALALIHEQGFDNVGIDLMNGLPGQTEKHWLKTLEEALSFGPAHISCYQLTIGSKTLFGKMAHEGKLKMPSEEKQRKIFLSTSRFLQERGFIHYEVSNFSQSEGCRSRHNLKYWRHIPYLGLGPAAHSCHNNRRWWNVRSLEQYCAALNKNNNKPVEGEEKLSPEQLELERLFLGFRNLEGVNIKNTLDKPLCENALKKLIASKHVEVHSGKIIPTVKGYLIADRLPLMISR